MPSPKVFISSTCYDLGMAREQLRSFLIRLGYEPILSEYSDVLYDPRAHTHTSCIQEVPNADMVVVLIGSRFGGRAVPEALSNVDLERLISTSFDVTVLSEPEKLSITQIEVLKAIDASVPVFAFVEEKVMHDHFVYQKNKELVDKIQFPSIDKPDSAKYIFEFINFLHHRVKGNSVIPFGKIEDIEIHLKKQWGSLFQKLLREQREQESNSRQIFSISEQIEDLKTALISTIGSAQARDVARGVIKYRRLFDVLYALKLPDISATVSSDITFEKLLESAGIEYTYSFSSRNYISREVLVKDDGTFFEVRVGPGLIIKAAEDWRNFKNLSIETRKIIFDAISEMEHLGMPILRHKALDFKEYFAEQLSNKDGELVDIKESIQKPVLGVAQDERNFNPSA